MGIKDCQEGACTYCRIIELAQPEIIRGPPKKKISIHLLTFYFVLSNIFHYEKKYGYKYCLQYSNNYGK